MNRWLLTEEKDNRGLWGEGYISVVGHLPEGPGQTLLMEIFKVKETKNSHDLKTKGGTSLAVQWR